MEKIDFDTFLKVDIRLGKICEAEIFSNARIPAIKLLLDFGSEIGLKKSSAQICDNYSPKLLIGMNIFAVVNFFPKQIGNFMSEVLVLGTTDLDKKGVILAVPDSEALIGGRML